MAARVDTPHTHTHTCLGLYIVGSKLALGHCLGRVAHCAGMYLFLIHFHRIKKKYLYIYAERYYLVYSTGYSNRIE
jgi:hypothetical protein